jgi:competence protein ComEC
VLKVAHHGSSSGTSEQFLRFVSPSAAFVSVSNGSRGLPGEDTMERLYRMVPHVLRTNETGDILLTVEDGALVVTPCKE